MGLKEMQYEIDMLYKKQCCETYLQEAIELAESDEWKKIIDGLAKGIYDEKTDTVTVNADLYFKTAQQLTDAVLNTFKGFAYDDNQNWLQAEIKANLFQFSGAKSLAESQAFAALLVDDMGNKRSFADFRNEVWKTQRLYNENYLRTEYNTALASCQNAARWSDYVRDGIEWLEYSTAGDARVRPKHALLDGLVFHISSPVLNRIYPPSDFDCRCLMKPGDKPANPISDKDAGALAKQVVTNPVFENNVGKTGIVFKDEHPYFQSTKGIKELDAVNNYGMKDIKTIMVKKADYVMPVHIDSVANYKNWWSDMVKAHGVNETDFVLDDVTGNKVLFDARDGKKNEDYFRDHIIRKKNENRHEYAANLVDILQTPDELFTRTIKGKRVWDYIKYYSDGVYTLLVEEVDGIIKAETLYKIEEANYAAGEIAKKRTGVLLYKKTRL